LLGKIGTDPRRQILKIFRSEMRISAGVGKFANQVTVILIDHLPRRTPFLALWEGVSFLCCLFVVV
jgi:hypothetical protein